MLLFRILVIVTFVVIIATIFCCQKREMHAVGHAGFCFLFSFFLSRDVFHVTPIGTVMRISLYIKKQAIIDITFFTLQLLQLSGILTVFFCGIVMSHYAWHNVSDSSRITTRYIHDFEVAWFGICCYHWLPSKLLVS